MQKLTLLELATIAIAIATAHASAQTPYSDRPGITVMAFDYATVGSQITGDTRTRYRFAQVGVHDGMAFAEALGRGAADLLVAKLVESERFRVFERKQLEAVKREQELDVNDADEVTRARYVITGSISRLGLNDKDYGGIVSGIASGAIFGRVVGMSAKGSSTTIHLTARVVDTRTGEIIGSFTGEGESKKRWGLGAFGIVPGGMGGARVADRNFRETAVGEATTRAAEAIAESVIALRATRLRP